MCESCKQEKPDKRAEAYDDDGEEKIAHAGQRRNRCFVERLFALVRLPWSRVFR